MGSSYMMTKYYTSFDIIIYTYNICSVYSISFSQGTYYNSNKHNIKKNDKLALLGYSIILATK